jgi:hypothetical protein
MAREPQGAYLAAFARFLGRNVAHRDAAHDTGFR